jgi:hypothetical protein
MVRLNFRFWILDFRIESLRLEFGYIRDRKCNSITLKIESSMALQDNSNSKI